MSFSVQPAPRMMMAPIRKSSAYERLGGCRPGRRWPRPGPTSREQEQPPADRPVEPRKPRIGAQSSGHPPVDPVARSRIRNLDVLAARIVHGARQRTGPKCEHFWENSGAPTCIWHSATIPLAAPARRTSLPQSQRAVSRHEASAAPFPRSRPGAAWRNRAVGRPAPLSGDVLRLAPGDPVRVFNAHGWRVAGAPGDRDQAACDLALRAQSCRCEAPARYRLSLRAFEACPPRLCGAEGNRTGGAALAPGADPSHRFPSGSISIACVPMSSRRPSSAISSSCRRSSSLRSDRHPRRLAGLAASDLLRRNGAGSRSPCRP